LIVPVTAGTTLFVGRPRVMLVAGAAATGPAVAPTVVDTAFTLSCGTSVPTGAPPEVAFVNVTVYVVPDPDTADATHGDAGAAIPLVPACEKSLVASPVTDSEKTRLYVADARVSAGEAATENEVTVGTAASAGVVRTPIPISAQATATSRRGLKRGMRSCSGGGNSSREWRVGTLPTSLFCPLSMPKMR
jgi:hypothetical protein